MTQTGPRRRFMPGFTLVELLIVLAITVLLLGVAAPSFSGALAGNLATSAGLIGYASARPFQEEFFVSDRTIPQIQIHQTLIRNSTLFSE